MMADDIPVQTGAKTVKKKTATKKVVRKKSVVKKTTKKKSAVKKKVVKKKVVKKAASRKKKVAKKGIHLKKTIVDTGIEHPALQSPSKTVASKRSQKAPEKTESIPENDNKNTSATDIPETVLTEAVVLKESEAAPASAAVTSTQAPTTTVTTSDKNNSNSLLSGILVVGLIAAGIFVYQNYSGESGKQEKPVDYANLWKKPVTTPEHKPQLQTEEKNNTDKKQSAKKFPPPPVPDYLQSQKVPLKKLPEEQMLEIQRLFAPEMFEK